MFPVDTDMTDLDLNDVLDQIYDNETDIPTIDSKYYDI